MTTIQYNLDDAEEFRLPSTGVHKAHLGTAELGQNKKQTHDMITVKFILSLDDPDAPNFPMSLYLMLPNMEDKEVMWGPRTAFGSMMNKVKETLSAIGGPESGSITKEKLMKILSAKEGVPVKVDIRQSVRKDMDPNDPAALSVNIEKVMPG